jgi:tetratricopeptide (TPR) repeat protein
MLKKAQWITLAVAIVSASLIYLFARTVPLKKNIVVEQHTDDDGHDHGAGGITIDSILVLAKKQLTPGQLVRISELENSISRGAVKQQQLDVYHQLSHFWADSMRIFEPYAWYEAEAARLENSEKSLNFAARLFLENLQTDEVAARRKWKALQAKDLFERSLKLNPGNDSAKVGLGATYLFGGISDMPMEGIMKIREVADRDSTNLYAQLTLAKGSIISGQYDKAMERLLIVNRHDPNSVDAILLLADVSERKGDREKAIHWYTESLQLVNLPEARQAIKERIEELKK